MLCPIPITRYTEYVITLCLVPAIAVVTAFLVTLSQAPHFLAISSKTSSISLYVVAFSFNLIPTEVNTVSISFNDSNSSSL